VKTSVMTMLYPVEVKLDFGVVALDGFELEVDVDEVDVAKVDDFELDDGFAELDGVAPEVDTPIVCNCLGSTTGTSLIP
jgi:hypothetical protein